MFRIHRILIFAAAALTLAAAHAADAQTSATRHRGGVSRSQELIDQAVRSYGFDPRRLSAHEREAIDDSWTELFGGGYAGRQRLNRAQATAIVYLALVHPYEHDRWRDRGPGYGGGWPDRGPGYGDRPDRGPGYGRPHRWDEACHDMERDAYQLGNLVAAPERHAGLFVAEPERGRARTLARRIQETAVSCRATEAADQAGEVLRALSDTLPARDAVSRRVELLKQAIRHAAPDGRPRSRR